MYHKKALNPARCFALTETSLVLPPCLIEGVGQSHRWIVGVEPPCILGIIPRGREREDTLWPCAESAPRRSVGDACTCRTGTVSCSSLSSRSGSARGVEVTGCAWRLRGPFRLASGPQTLQSFGRHGRCVSNLPRSVEFTREATWWGLPPLGGVLPTQPPCWLQG